MSKRIQTFKHLYNELSEIKLNAATSMYLEDLEGMNLSSNGKKTNLAMFLRIRGIINQLELLFSGIKHEDTRFRFKELYDKVQICLANCDDDLVCDKINQLYQEFLILRNRIANDLLDLVLVVAGKFANLSVDMDEIIQWGNIGLLRAIEMFDPNSSDNFNAYSYLVIKGVIIDNYFRQQYSVLLSIRDYRQVSILEDAISELSVILERVPSYQELSKYLDVSLNKINLLFKLIELKDMENCVDLAYSDELGCEDLLIKKETRDLVLKSFECLTDFQAFVLKMELGFYDGCVYKNSDVARMVGAKRQSTFTSKRNGLKRLKKKCPELIRYLSD